MSQLLYYTVNFVSLHQKNPGFNFGNSSSVPNLKVGDIETSQKQYALVSGYGDPGEKPEYDFLDYTEWSTGFSTFVRPADFSTATGSYNTEGLGGTTTSNTYKIWHSISVPDTFLLPAKYLSPTGDDWHFARWDTARSFALTTIQAAADTPISELAAVAGILNTTYGLNHSLVGHMDAQFALIDQVTKGQITVEQFEQMSDNASRGLLIDLANTTPGAFSAVSNSLVANQIRELIAQQVVTTDPAHGQAHASSGSTSTAGFWPPDVKYFLEVGSPSNDHLNDHGYNGDVVAGGLGDDTVFARGGNGILVGGAGVDTIDYSAVAGGVTVNFSNSQAYSNSFTDRIAGFENAVGASGNDTFAADNGANALSGGPGNDTFFAVGGNDILNGGEGADLLNGGDGRDTAIYSRGIFDPVYFTYTGLKVSLKDLSVNTGEAKGDTLISIENLSGSDAGDTLLGDDFDNTLSGNRGNDTINGASGDDLLMGGDGNDSLDGTAGIDTASFQDKAAAVALTLNGPNAVRASVGGALEDTLRNIEDVIGGSGADRLFGDGFANHLRGGPGSDTLGGGLGDDILEGGPGKDALLFNALLGGVDTVVGFSAGDDKIDLDNAIFKKLGNHLGQLKSKFFHVGAKAHDKNDYVLYDKNTGALSYDSDGRKHAHVPVEFAFLDDHLKLTNGDFLVV